MMSNRSPACLDPSLIDLASPEFDAICGWEYKDGYIGRLLRDDIPRRMRFGCGMTWVYRDRGGQLVGFGTIDLCDDCRAYSGGQFHQYIPLLAVNPQSQGRGYGSAIVAHLIEHAAVRASHPGSVFDTLFLDVYTDNEPAIKLYEKFEFRRLHDHPIPDNNEGGRPYFVMARRVSIATLPTSH